MKSIVWLASYPKSGNTWVRIFLANYLSPDGGPVDINALATGPIASSRDVFDDLTGVDAADLTPEEIMAWRPDVYRLWSAEASAPHFVKAHDAQIQNSHRQWLFPPDASAGVIYSVRNPLDVAVSFAAHAGVSIDLIVDRMCRDYSMSAGIDRPSGQLTQRLLTWSGHVGSWLDGTEIPTLAVRYEDLLADPMAHFRAVVQFAGLQLDENRLESAVRHSHFESLRAQELAHGFKERPAKSADHFFRQGRSGGWRAALSHEHARTVIEAHGAVMRRFGYLTADGEPV